MSYTDGFVRMRDRNRDMAIVGRAAGECAERTKRLAARVSQLDILASLLTE